MINWYRRVTNKDRNGKSKKAIWYEDTAREVRESEWGPEFQDVPSRYGPRREYLANCMSIEAADRFVALWNKAVEAHEDAPSRFCP